MGQTAQVRTPSPLVLASGSRYRAEVLRAVGFDVEIDPPEVDERSMDHLFARDPESLARRLARMKAEAVAPRRPGSWIVAADQVGVLELDGHRVQLTKQPDEDRAVEQLVAMSGTTHTLVNGVVVLRTMPDGRPGRSAEGTDTQLVTMRIFSEPEARRYVRRFEPYDSAGSYRLEDQDLMVENERLVVSVQGEDRSGVLGMPVPLLLRLLSEVGNQSGD
jgi:septum formation protein